MWRRRRKRYSVFACHHRCAFPTYLKLDSLVKHLDKYHGEALSLEVVMAVDEAVYPVGHPSGGEK